MKTMPGHDMIIGDTDVAEKSTPLEKRFDKLWQQLQSKQHRNELFEQQVEEARDWINTKLTDTRTQYQKALIQQTEKLISHLLKKSLAQWQRTELCEWIEGNISILEAQHAPNLQALVRTYVTNKLSQVSDRERGAIEDAFDTSIEDILAELAATEDDDLDSDDEFDNSEDDFTDEFEETFDDYQTHPDDHTESTTEKLAADKSAKQRSTFKASMVNKLFRRTARALHPDHEHDPKRREEKQALMKELLQARKSGNIVKIFKMYRENVSGEKIQIDLPELKPMIELLVQQVAELDTQYERMTFESPIHDWVKNNIVGKSKQKRLKAFEAMRKDIERDIEEINEISPMLSSLAKLKPLLEERYDHFRYNFF